MYPTCLCDEQWHLLKPILDSYGLLKQKTHHPMRNILSGIFYVLDNGVKWMALPREFPPLKTVNWYFNKWSHCGLWLRISLAMTEITRILEGREASPSLSSIDSQSQSGEPGILGRGLDGNKKVNGRKRHIAVDSLGLLLICICTAANVADSVTGRILAGILNCQDQFPRIAKILGDSVYGSLTNFRVPVTVESSLRKKGQKGFIPEAFRWAVERTFAWFNRCRRLVRNYEKNPLHQESMNYIANIRLCLKRMLKGMDYDSR